jgi:uracil-DNA glycosylase family 4
MPAASAKTPSSCGWPCYTEALLLLTRAAMSSPFTPQQSPRHVAMLKAMGVGVWWHPVAEEAAHEAVVQSHVAPAEMAAVAQRVELPVKAASHPVTPAAPMRVASAPVGASPAAPVVVQRVSTGALSTLDWQALQDTLVGCQQCELSQRRRQVVPGAGDAQRPDWLFVGEAPGEEEDIQGQPFVGRSGQLLDRMLAAMGLQRAQQVFITNVVKCRPPMNRNPQPQEVQQCSPYLLRQIELLQPRIIVALGRFAAYTVLGQAGCLGASESTMPPLGKLRGQVHTGQFGGLSIPVVATFHPSYLLRSPAEKSKAWADLCLAMHTLDGQAPRS